MPFGRWRGVELEELPSSYLDWLLTISLRWPLSEAVRDEHERRRASKLAAALVLPACPDRDLAADLVKAGQRALAKRCHPDAGGSHEDFLRLTEVAEWLSGIVEDSAA